MAAPTRQQKKNKSRKPQQEPPQAPPVSSQGARETVESIVVAVILAFLFRSFVGEAFIIPTGSMAPTLQGRHLDVKCDGCRFRYRAGASRDNPSIVACPNCGLRKEPAYGFLSNESAFAGDRILVSKFTYDLVDPQRWEVIVFKFPGNAKQNYIKRLVGLSNEMLMIWRGNVHSAPELFQIDGSEAGALASNQLTPAMRQAFEAHGVSLSEQASVAQSPLRPFEVNRDLTRVVRDGDQQFIVAQHGENEGSLHVFAPSFEILRRPESKLLAMLQCVHDSRYVNESLHEAGWPLRWISDDWKSEDVGRTYRVEGAAELQWLAYRQLQPSASQWSDIQAGRLVAPPSDTPGELITDYYAYNFPTEDVTGDRAGQYGRHWVADLAVEATVKSSDGQGAVWLDLIRAGHHFQCRLDLESGEAQLRIQGAGAPEFTGAGQPTTQSAAKGAGTYRLRMANVDDQLHVWVNGRQLQFDADTTYPPLENDAPMWSESDPGDTQPVRIGSEGASLTVSKMRVLRDIYYIAVNANSRTEDDMDGMFPQSELGRETLWRNPRQWMPLRRHFFDRQRTAYVMGDQEYFPMGDNSPYSEDARRWSHRNGRRTPHYVEDELMIGKALLIYWPHHWRPFFPNFGRMGLIR